MTPNSNAIKPSSKVDIEINMPSEPMEPLLLVEPKPRQHFTFNTNSDITTANDSTNGHSSSFGTKKNPLLQKKKKKQVHYDTDSHFNVLFQMHGSVWPQVLPYCLASVVLTYLIAYLRDHLQLDLTFPSSNGHNFMAIMVSYFCSIACHRYA